MAHSEAINRVRVRIATLIVISVAVGLAILLYIFRGSKSLVVPSIIPTLQSFYNKEQGAFQLYGAVSGEHWSRVVHRLEGEEAQDNDSAISVTAKYVVDVGKIGHGVIYSTEESFVIDGVPVGITYYFYRGYLIGQRFYISLRDLDLDTGRKYVDDLILQLTRIFSDEPLDTLSLPNGVNAWYAENDSKKCSILQIKSGADTDTSTFLSGDKYYLNIYIYADNEHYTAASYQIGDLRDELSAFTQ